MRPLAIPTVAIATMAIATTLALGAGPASAAGTSSSGGAPQRVDFIADSGFESAGPSCFAPYPGHDASAAITTDRPLDGEHSLAVSIRPWSALGCEEELGYDSGPSVDAVGVSGHVRVDALGEGGDGLEACVIAYFSDSQEPERSCATYTDLGRTAVVDLALDGAGRQLSSAFFQLDANGTAVDATLDDAQLFAAEEVAVAAPQPVIRRVDLVGNGSFEATTNATCFEPFSNNQATTTVAADHPINGAKSLQVAIETFSNVGCTHVYPFAGGPFARSVTVEGDLRVDEPIRNDGRLQVCAVVYFQDQRDPENTCTEYSFEDGQVEHVQLMKDAGGRQLARAVFQLSTSGSPVRATLDDAHLFVDEIVTGNDPEPKGTDALSGGDFESGTGCFAPFSGNDATAVTSDEDPIDGAQSLAVDISPWSTVGCLVDFPFEGGPTAQRVSAVGDLRVDAVDGDGSLDACVVVYFADSQEPERTCASYRLDGGAVEHVVLPKDTDGRQIARAFVQLSTTGDAVQAQFDDARLLIDAA